MGMLDDLERGTVDRFLVSPVSRTALIAGPIAQAAVVVVVQSLIIVGVAILRGKSYDGGATGIAVLLLASVLLALPFAAFSNAVALTSRSREAMIGSVQFIALPLTFLAAGFMPIDLAPGWIQGIARFNPVNWAVEATRAAQAVDVDWGFVLARLGWLTLLAAVTAAVATGAFRTYQKAV
jgi:ABC-2 type transport system permease protein